MAIETELKLQIAPEQVEVFLQHPLLQTVADGSVFKHLYSTYFDTFDCALLKKGIGLRIRKIGDKYVQTIKTAGSGLGGLHQRQEWETEVSGEMPDFKQLPNDILPMLKGINLNHVEAIFTTDFMRQTWQLKLETGNHIELALDLGKIETPLASEPLHEIELELKSGSVAQIYQTALSLQKALPLTIENQSKAERGYALYRPKQLHIHKAITLDLTLDMTAEQAFVALSWSCLAHLQANEEMVLCGTDIEGVHQMRVALRRLRTLFKLYEPLIPAESHRKLRKKLKWVAKILETARDWDVFAETLQVINKQLPKDSLLKALKKMVAQQRRCAYTAVRTMLRSPRYSRLLLQMSFWLVQQDWRKKCGTEELSHLNQPVQEFANKSLRKCLRKVYRQAEQLEKLDAKQRHSLRIAVKELTYGARFFATLYPTESVTAYKKILSQLQDELGILNDTRVAFQLLNQTDLAVDVPVRYFLRGWYLYQQMDHSTRLTMVWQTFSTQVPFWQ
jgi:inorganic triphosphatase YgiF